MSRDRAGLQRDPLDPRPRADLGPPELKEWLAPRAVLVDAEPERAVDRVG
jgi:hypothetical protein